MSLIRFIHAGPIRLGTPIAGVADSPGWLAEHLAGSLRRAFLNVLESAVANHADFVFFDGPLTECPDILPSVTRWVADQLNAFRKHGIQIIVRASDQTEASLLMDVADVVLQNDQQLLVNQPDGKRLEFTIEDHAIIDTIQTCDLRITPSQALDIHASRAITASRVHYHCLAGNRPSDDCDLHFDRGVASLCAGAIQAVSPDESWDCGCVLVETNTATREVVTEFLETDVVRFSTEQIALPHTATVESVIRQVSENAAVLGKASAKTLIIDWNVQGDLHTDWNTVSQLSESEMLSQLRQRLQAGHRGVWPRRMTFEDHYNLDLTALSRHESIEEFIHVACGDVASWNVDREHQRRVAFRGTRATDAAVVEGLRLLNRAA